MKALEQELCIGSLNLAAACQVANQFLPDLSPPDVIAAKAGGDRRRKIVVYIGRGIDSAIPQGVAQTAHLVQSCKAELDKAQADFWAVELPKFVYENANSVQGMNQLGLRIGARGNSANVTSTTQSANQYSPLSGIATAVHGRRFDFQSPVVDQRKFFEWILAGTPYVTTVSEMQIQDIETEAVLSPQEFYYTTQILPGEPLRVSGRMTSAGKLRLKYAMENSSGLKQTQQVELTAANGDDHLVGRYWAEQRYKRLDWFFNAPTNEGGDEQALHGIVRLSREWSLLTPHTAFLVLESEKDYVTWGVPRQARRKYWSADGIPQVPPLSKTWLAEVAPESVLQTIGKEIRPRAGKDLISDERITEILLSARRELNESQLDSAERSLNLLKHLRAGDRPEYRELRAALDLARKQISVLNDFGMRQAWFDFNAKPAPVLFSLDRLLSSPNITADSFGQQPFAEALLQEVDLPAGTMTMREFAKWLKPRIGGNIYLDLPSLEDETISVDLPHEIPRMQRVALQNALDVVLEPINMGYHADPRGVTLTTRSIVAGRKVLQYFPLQDLIDPIPRFELADLYDPILDREAAVRRRIEGKLKKSVKLNLTDATLIELANQLRHELGENVIIRTHKLEEETIALDTSDLNCEFYSVRWDDALSWILSSKSLTYHITQDALVITTKEDRRSLLPVRVYPASGLVHYFKQVPNSGAAVGSFQSTSGPWSASNLLGIPLVYPTGAGASMGFGGMGGGFGGGMGGMGGGMGGGFAVSSPPAAPIAISNADTKASIEQSTASSSSSPQQSKIPDAPLSQASNHRDSQLAVNLRTNSDAGGMLRDIMRLTGGEEESEPWQQVSGEGGQLGFYFPSLTFAVRQSDSTHKQIEKYFQGLREAQTRSGINPNSVPIKPEEIVSDATQFLDAASILRLILQITGGQQEGGPWFQINGEGGDLSYDPARNGLHARNNPRVQGQINALLVQLRRERYAALHNNSRPWERPRIKMSGPASLLPDEWLKPSSGQPVGVPQPKTGEATALEMELLKVRKEISEGAWTWTDAKADVAKESPTAISLRRAADGKLRVVWPEFEVQIDAVDATFISKGLHYQETGRWSNSVREWLDVEIPLWPHRSNQELAELFDISLIADSPAANSSNKPMSATRKLRFVPARVGDAPFWLEVTFDQKTGACVEWIAMSKGKMTARYTFTTESIEIGAQGVTILNCQDSAGRQGRWVPRTAAVGKAASDGPVAESADMLRIDRRSPMQEAATEIRGIAELRQGKFKEAAEKFQATLEKFPQQPLIKFLLAWTMDLQEPPLPTEQIKAAYADAIRTGPHVLWETLLHHGTSRLSASEMYEVLNQIPAEARSSDDERRLAEERLREGHSEQAVGHLESAWNMQPTDGSQFALIDLLIEANLRQLNVTDALKWYTTWHDRKEGASILQLAQLLELFATHRRNEFAVDLWQQLIKREDFPRLTAEIQRTVYLGYANALEVVPERKIDRWIAMLNACELLPDDHRQSKFELDRLISELEQQKSNAAETTLRLAAMTKVTAHRLQLNALAARQLGDDQAAAKLNWDTYQAGYRFPDNLTSMLNRMNRAGQFEKTISIGEAKIRKGEGLTLLEQQPIAEAYEKLDQPEMATRVRLAP
jgi:hypothetical protein